MMSVRRAARHSPYLILTIAFGLALVVSVTLAWLGWRNLMQQEAIEKQQAQSRLQESADRAASGFLSRLEEVRAALSRAAEGPLPLVSGAAVTVRFSPAGFDTVQPPGRLIYYPVSPATESFPPEIFEDAHLSEFRIGDLARAQAAVQKLTRSTDPLVAAEARFRLARIQKNRGLTAAALATYTAIGDERRIKLDMELPYGFISRFYRCELLLQMNKPGEARAEASELLTELHAGGWPMSAAAYVLYEPDLQTLAGRPGGQAPPDARAVANAVEKVWQLWRAGGAVTDMSVQSTSEPATALALGSVTSGRLVVSVYTTEALREWVATTAAAHAVGGTRVMLRHERDEPIAGSLEAEGLTARAVLTGLPWSIEAASDMSSGADFAAQRRVTVILALAIVAALVSLACYAVARGVIREAAAGQLQTDFVSAVSHEFRSPLTTLRQLTELLADGRIVDEDRRRQYFNVLQRETSRLHQLVEDLLDFGRMDAGRREYKLQPLDLSELVRRSIEDYQQQAGANGHTIQTSFEPTVVVEADREAMYRVVRNLLENAVKYSPGSPTVWVETGCEERSAILRVRDAGIGIPAGERSRIFDKFVRGDAAREACIAGTGIGLAMVKEIVRVHHGSIQVSSEVGHGSTFEVRLPRERVESQA